MDNILLEERFIAEEYRDPDLAEIPQITQASGSAVTGITSVTITVNDPGDGTRNIELPQALGTGASPTFNDVTLTDDLSVADLADVGDLRVGGGTILRQMVTGNVAADPGSINGQTRGSVDVTVTGMTPGDRVVIQPPDGLEAGLAYVGCRVVGTDTLRIYLANLTGAAIDGGSQTYSYLWFDFT
jgi:hypothetical protein